MTLQFICFGLLISYFTLLLMTISTGRRLIENFTDQITENASLFPGDGEAWVEEMFIDSPEKGQALMESIRENVPMENRPNISFALFRKKGDEGEWNLIYQEGTISDVKPDGILGDVWIDRLEDSLKEGVSHKGRFYFGQSEARGVLLKLSSPDDVGILSRQMDEMTLHLRHRARTMETMNRIDRAVLSSLSRDELLSRVAGFIADQFDRSSVVVLERGEKDYRILALLSDKEGYGKSHLPYDELDGSLVNPSDSPFCLEENPDRGLYLLLGEEGVKRNNLAFPLILEEKVMGLIIVSRDELAEHDRSALEKLSDQVGVALKSLTEAKAREILYDSMMLSLTRSVDAKSQWTAGHSERVTTLALMLAGKLDMDRPFRDMVRVGGLLHDIGKLAIPEAILDKPGRLDEGEFHIIRSHPERGYEIIKDIPDFDEARHAVRSHHEKWDGTGYPDGLKGEAIPLIARIITICDVYDAVTEDRPYRKGFSREEAREFMLKERGKLFDPSLLDSFIEIFDSQDKD